MARVKGGELTDALEREGVVDRLGASRIYPEVCEVVEDLVPDEADER